MTKKNFKILLILLVVIATLFSFSSCFADENDIVTISDTDETNPITTGEDSIPEIHNGDLYLFDTKVVMDKLVDGNVYIFGKDVEITGQVKGNLFVCANNLKFNNSYVTYSIYACANSIYYNGACSDLYAACSNIEMTYDSYVVRDVKLTSGNAVFKAAVGRNADIACSQINFGEGEDAAIIYGNLNYSALKQANIPESVITQDRVSFNQKQNSEKTISVKSIIIDGLVAIVTVLILYLLISKLAPKFAERIENRKLSALELLKAFGFGLLAWIALIIVVIILLLTQVGVKLAFIVGLLFAVLCLVSLPIFTMHIANSLKTITKADKTYKFYILLALVSLVLYGITFIPVIGVIVSFLLAFIQLGTTILDILPQKELSDEEKAKIEEAKNQKKELKEKAKQEKLAAKEAKKENK